MPETFERQTESIIKTPTYAKQVARWAIEFAEGQGFGEVYAKITAKLFTAFMFEGVIHTVGEALISDWCVSENGQRPIERQPLAEKHKLVRRKLGFDNGTAEYQQKRNVIERLIGFRDTFAHPKIIESYLTVDYVSDLSESLPPIAWEAEISNLVEIKSDYELLVRYCRTLCETCSTKLTTEYNNYTEFRSTYPHIADSEVQDIIHNIETMFLMPAVHLSERS